MSSLETDSAGVGGNPDLRTMHRDLVALVHRLEESIDAAKDAAAIAVITEQMVEVNARVTSTGRALLTSQTEEIARRAKAVSKAIPAIEKEIEDLQDCERMVGSIAALLGTVDEAVRIASLASG